MTSSFLCIVSCNFISLHSDFYQSQPTLDPPINFSFPIFVPFHSRISNFFFFLRNTLWSTLSFTSFFPLYFLTIVLLIEFIYNSCSEVCIFYVHTSVFFQTAPAALYLLCDSLFPSVS